MVTKNKLSERNLVYTGKGKDIANMCAMVRKMHAVKHLRNNAMIILEYGIDQRDPSQINCLAFRPILGDYVFGRNMIYTGNGKVYWSAGTYDMDLTKQRALYKSYTAYTIKKLE